MSPAQKAALKKAQEISARLRRGTGKPDAPSKPRKAAAPEPKPGSRFLRKDPAERKASILNRKLTKVMHRNLVRTGSEGDPKSVGAQAKKRLTPKQRADRVRKASGAKKPSGRVTLQELARRSQSGPQPKARPLSDYQKADDAIWGEHRKKLVQLENDYAQNRITKRQFELRKKKLGDETMAKVKANKEKHNRDERGNPKPNSGASQKLSSTAGQASNANRQAELAKKAGMSLAEYKKKMAADSRKMTKSANEQTGGVYGSRPKSNLRQTPGGSKPAMGTADPATLPVSHILRERKELIAKQKSEGLTPEENKRLVAIKAESALRHQNRKAGKGTGPTKIALGDKKAADAPKQGEWKHNSSAVTNRDVTVPEYETTNNRGQKVGIWQHGSGKGWVVGPDRANTIHYSTLDKAKQAAMTMDTDALKKSRNASASKPDAAKGSESTKKKLASSIQPGDVFRRYDGDREVVSVEPQGNGKYKFITKMKGSQGTGSFTADRNEQLDVITASTKANDANSAKLDSAKKPPSSYNDKTTFGTMAPDDRRKMSEMRYKMQKLQKDFIDRQELGDELNAAKSVGELVDAAQSIYWYLDEQESFGYKTDAARKIIDPLFEELKKYSSRYRQKSTAGVSQPPLRRNQRGHNPRAGVFGADKWGRRPGGR